MDDSLRIVLLEDPSRPSTDELRRSLALLGSDVSMKSTLSFVGRRSS
jgi:hypothetical protein